MYLQWEGYKWKWTSFRAHFIQKTESPLHFEHPDWWKRQSRSKFASHIARGTNGIYMWMQDGCRVYMDSYMASNRSCFMVTWFFFFQKPPLDNRWFILFCHVWGPHEQKFIEIAFSWGPSHIWLHITLEGPWPHYMILEVSWDGFWMLSSGFSQFHGHGSWLVCEVTLIRSHWHLRFVGGKCS